jgi:DNA polymerase III epsilon subunit-like protein
MRRVNIDIATTGMEVDARVIEVALIEEIDGKRAGNSFNRLINPEGKPMTEAAIDVTGYSNEFLKQFFQFYAIAPDIRTKIKKEYPYLNTMCHALHTNTLM